jgi:hypothetical protein
MELLDLNQRTDIYQNKKLNNLYSQFGELLLELDKRELPYQIANSINRDLERLNSFEGSEKELKKLTKKTQSVIIKLLEKELKIVTRNHYRNTWLSIGMSIGVGIGAALGASLGNMALIGAGIPIGMGIGIAVGTGMDKKASKEGRQLDVEIKY